MYNDCLWLREARKPFLRSDDPTDARSLFEVYERLVRKLLFVEEVPLTERCGQLVGGIKTAEAQHDYFKRQLARKPIEQSVLAYHELLVWSILTGRFQLSELFWQRGG